MSGGKNDTSSATYTDRLIRLQTVWWKRLLPVQAPYRAHLRRLRPGFVLDVGCGIGRNLSHLAGNGVGIDHNPCSVEVARARGFRAFTPADFAASEYAREGTFDALLLSHVAEHLRPTDFAELLSTYLPFLRAGARVIVITPQEAGYHSDDSHVAFVGFQAIESAAGHAGIVEERSYSFPFPRVIGHVFTYNEFVWIGRAPGGAAAGPVA